MLNKNAKVFLCKLSIDKNAVRVGCTRPAKTKGDLSITDKPPLLKGGISIKKNYVP